MFPGDSVKSVDKCMLVMVPSMEPVTFSPHKTVSLRGFGPAARNSLKSVPDSFILESVSEHCLPNIMQMMMKKNLMVTKTNKHK